MWCHSATFLAVLWKPTKLPQGGYFRTPLLGSRQSYLVSQRGLLISNLATCVIEISVVEATLDSVVLFPKTPRRV